MTDPIADMLTRIRNANTSKHDTVDVPASKMKTAIAEILLEEKLFHLFPRQHSHLLIVKTYKGMDTQR